MRGVRPEPIREHLVEVLDTAYPPKQVLAAVTGWQRTSFTTMEAQRVLTRAGFACRRADEDDKAGRGWSVDQPATPARHPQPVPRAWMPGSRVWTLR